MSLDVAAGEMAKYVLFGIMTNLPFFLITRFMVYDGQMVGMHRDTWFMAVTYVFGIIGTTLLSIGRAMFFNFGSTGGVQGDAVHGAIWTAWVVFTLIQSVTLSLWPILAKRISVETRDRANPSLNLVVFGPATVVILVVAAACMLVEWGLLGGLSFGERQVIPNGIAFYLAIPSMVWHVWIVGGLAYYLSARYKKRSTQPYGPVY